MNRRKETIVQEQRIALVVDDDEDFLFQQKAALERLGFAVVTAGGRADATAQLARIQPALAVVDLMMEEKDGGFILARDIKRSYPDTFVILVTAVTAETGLQFTVDAPELRRWIRADALLAKPVRFEQLKREIGRMPA
jgi:CheY-like chemotaxis protein